MGLWSEPWLRQVMIKKKKTYCRFFKNTCTVAPIQRQQITREVFFSSPILSALVAEA